MTSWTEIGAFAALGVAGSLHCAGMCGPFALSLGWNRPRGRAAWIDPALYVSGKSATYALLALALASGARWLDGAGPGNALGGARAALSWIAGLAMVLLALQGLGLWSVGAAGRVVGLQRPLAALLRASRALPPAGRSFGLGLANGFLPCGLSASAIALAASADPATVVLGPLAFGLASAPPLVVLACGGGAIPSAWRRRGQRLTAVLLLVFGAATIVRGCGAWTGEPGGGPPCCPETPATAVAGQ